MNSKLIEIATYLEHERAALIACVEALSQQQLDHRPAEGVWSAGEVLHHLYLVEASVAKLVAKQLEKARAEQIGPPTDGSVLDSLDHLLLNVPAKTEAPKAVAPQAKRSKTELFAELEQSHSALRVAINAAAEFDLHQLHFPHPVLGEIDLYQWMLFIGKHEHRHTKQINRLKAAENFPGAEPVSPTEASHVFAKEGQVAP